MTDPIEQHRVKRRKFQGPSDSDVPSNINILGLENNVTNEHLLSYMLGVSDIAFEESSIKDVPFNVNMPDLEIDVPDEFILAYERSQGMGRKKLPLQASEANVSAANDVADRQSLAAGEPLEAEGVAETQLPVPLSTLTQSDVQERVQPNPQQATQNLGDALRGRAHQQDVMSRTFTPVNVTAASEQPAPRSSQQTTQNSSGNSGQQARRQGNRPKITNTEEARKFVREHLILLLHSHKCRRLESQPNGETRRCNLRQCDSAKSILEHLPQCTANDSCPVYLCSTSRRILKHWRDCNTWHCSVCETVSQRFGRNRNGPRVNVDESE